MYSLKIGIHGGWSKGSSNEIIRYGQADLDSGGGLEPCEPTQMYVHLDYIKNVYMNSGNIAERWLASKS